MPTSHPARLLRRQGPYEPERLVHPAGKGIVGLEGTRADRDPSLHRAAAEVEQPAPGTPERSLGGVEDELVHPELLEGGGPLLDRLWCAGCAHGDSLRPLTGERVVGAEVAERLLDVLLSQGEVRQDDDPRLPLAAGLLPREATGLDRPGGHLRRGAPDRIARAPPRGPRRRQARLAAEEQWDPAPRGRRADRELAPGDRLTSPGLVQQLQVGVEPPAAVRERPAGQLVVVGPCSHPEAEGEAAA